MPITPELSVTDHAASLRFYRDVLGFRLRYGRDGFSFLDLEDVSLMIDQIGEGRDFHPGLTAKDRPLGRGINLEIDLPDITPILARIEASGLPLYLPLEEKWYAREHDEIGQRQFIIADPDGYLLRFACEIGTRPLS